MKIAIVGGGASGFFSAINCKLIDSQNDVIIFEKTSKLLSKVLVSGGGRCNITNAEKNKVMFSKNYPRGEKVIREALSIFSQEDMVFWLQKRGIKVKVEEDGRVFPVSNTSKTVVDCFIKMAKEQGIEIRLKSEVKEILYQDGKFKIRVNDQFEVFDRVILAIGGYTQKKHYNVITNLGHKLIEPIPSLFTFNAPNFKFSDLQGVSVKKSTVSVIGTKFKQHGEVLITHWGLSGPAVIKLSAWSAVFLNQCGYKYCARINWLGDLTENEVNERLEQAIVLYRQSKVKNVNPFNMPHRLWERLLILSGIKDDFWKAVSKKQCNKLVQNLTNTLIECEGKTLFKEEFVTAGGVDLNEIDTKTMESKKIKGLYFCGEVLNIDGLTGGFNFQNAWTTGYIVAINCIKKD
jgi:predicted Rossmann fold flavoprotein